MAALPSRRRADKALRDAIRAAQATVKEANRHAGQLVAKGDYAEAERFVSVAKAAGEVQVEMRSLHQRWREAVYGNGKSGQDRSERTPLWQYYRPILIALAALNGSATIRDLERHFETTASGSLKPGDLEVNASGRPRWKAMLRQARRPMVKEKFIEDDAGKNWVMTSAGRRVLESPPAQA